MTAIRKVTNTMALLRSALPPILVAHCVLYKVEIKVHRAAQAPTISQHPLLKRLIWLCGIAPVPLLKTSRLCAHLYFWPLSPVAMTFLFVFALVTCPRLVWINSEPQVSVNS